MRSAWIGRALLVALASIPVVACAEADDNLESDVDELNAPSVTSTEAVARAKEWSDVKLQYCWAPRGGDNHAAGNRVCAKICQRQAHPQWDPYRSDCSGLVSWAWKLPAPGRTTWMFAPFKNDVSRAINAAELQPGDAINNEQHIMLFKNWVKKGTRARFIEEPGCGSGMGHAREVENDVTLNGQTISLRGRASFTAIRYINIRSAEPAPETPDSGTPDDGDDEPEKPPMSKSATLGGAIDHVSCEGGIKGWAKGAEEQRVDVDLSFDEQPAPASKVVKAVANKTRAELPAGRSDYGFMIEIPLGIRDGQPHRIFGLAVDGDKTKKLDGEFSVTCAPPTFPVGATEGKRRLVTKAALEYWGDRTVIEDVAKAPAATAKKYEEGPSFPASPLVVQTDDEKGSLFVVDGQLSRPIDTASLAKWALKVSPEKRSAQLLAQELTPGPSWPKTPFFFEGEDGNLYALDTDVPEGASRETPASVGGTGDPAAEEEGNPDNVPEPPSPRSRSRAATQASSGCSTQGGSMPGSQMGGAVVGLALALSAMRRRKKN